MPPLTFRHRPIDQVLETRYPKENQENQVQAVAAVSNNKGTGHTASHLYAERKLLALPHVLQMNTRNPCECSA